MQPRINTIALRLATIGLVALSLAGCVEDFPDARVSRGDVRAAIAGGTLASPRGATVAMASLEGAPVGTKARFDEAFRKAAGEREIAMADAGSAHYLVRGYLSTAPSDSGTELSYVYDIFDANDRRRMDRVHDTLTVPGSGPDAWALVTDQVMASLAGRSADDLAVVLAGTPEARAGGSVVAVAAPTTVSETAR